MKLIHPSVLFLYGLGLFYSLFDNTVIPFIRRSQACTVGFQKFLMPEGRGPGGGGFSL